MVCLVVDVCLVMMPYISLCHPSPALGTLKSCLKGTDITLDTVYANLLFAEEIGYDAYVMLENTLRTELASEWIFAYATFPEHSRNLDAYAQQLPTCW
jgi:hypothetical protein